MADQEPMRIVVEVISSADVKRLEGRDDDLWQEIARVEGKLEGLHKTLYELMERLSRPRGK